MKTDIFAKTMLAIVVLALLVIAIEHINPLKVVHAQAAPRWEYSRISANYRWQNGRVEGIASINQDGKTLSENSNIRDLMRDMGTKGWELVSDMPISTQMGLSGTTNEILMFKRPLR